MPCSIKPLLLLLLLLGFHIHLTAALARNQFQKWYPEWAYTFSTVIRENCTREYYTYLHGSLNTSTIDEFTGGDPTNQLAQPVVNCILANISPFIQSGMASAQVMLGLTPSILAAMGPSTEETSLLLAVGRRPFLALCIAAGSPAIYPMRMFKVNDPLRLLDSRKGRLLPPSLGPFRGSMTVVCEYLVVIGAIFNVAILSKQLGVQVICIFAPHLTYLVLLWAFAMLVVHGSGALALLLRARAYSEQSSNTFFGRVRRQFTPFATQGPIKVEVRDETYLFTFVQCFTAILTVCHTIYGTLVFSSMLFISVRDSVIVIGRFSLSVIVCRVVLMYELAALSEKCNASAGKGSEVGLRSGITDSELAGWRLLPGN